VSDCEEAVGQAPAQSSGLQLSQITTGLLLASVVSLAGLFLQVARLDQRVGTLMDGVAEMKTDSKERLKVLEDRVRQIELAAMRSK